MIDNLPSNSATQSTRPATPRWWPELRDLPLFRDPPITRALLRLVSEPWVNPTNILPMKDSFKTGSSEQVCDFRKTLSQRDRLQEFRGTNVRIGLGESLNGLQHTAP